VRYMDMVKMLKELKQSGGFSPHEPLDSIDRIAESGCLDFISAIEISAYATALAGVQEWDRAEAVARSISDEEEQENTLFEIAQSLARKNLFDRAEELTFTTEAHYPSSISEKIFTLNEIASCYLKNHQEEQAIIIVKKAEEALESYPERDFTRAWMIDEMAEIWDKLGQKEQALELWKESAIILARLLKEARLGGGYCDYESLKRLLYVIHQFGRYKEYDLARQAIYGSLGGRRLEDELKWLDELQKNDSDFKASELSES
jgi:tetratricopeptide (TPR) repeat protein